MPENPALVALQTSQMYSVGSIVLTVPRTISSPSVPVSVTDRST